MIHAALLLLIFLITLSPWMIRQFIYYQDVILIRADTGRKMFLFKENKIVTGREKEDVTIEEEPVITDWVGKTADAGRPFREMLLLSS